MSQRSYDAASGSIATYTTGFVLSVILTLAAYAAVVGNAFEPRVLIAAIFGLAVIQLQVQLVYFLHLGRESKPRWNLTVFAFMLIVLVIVVFGSLWIMNNLNYHMVEPETLDAQIIQDEGVLQHDEHHD